MHPRIYLTLLAIGAVVVAVAPAMAQDASPRDPVFNGEFELDSPVGPALKGTPADECIGIGHQVLYGSETPVGHVTGGPYHSPNASRADPVGGAEDVANDPVNETLWASGYGHCEFSSENGYDLCWCNPAGLTSDEAIHWSGHDDDIVADQDGDGDREIRVTNRSSEAGPHNFWQAWPSPHQAYSGNFDALEFDVESGSIPSNAHVDVTFDVAPFEAQTPYAVIFGECQLTFSAGQFSSGQNSVPAVDGDFRARSEECHDAWDAWNNSDDAGKRDVLGRLRIVQLSFWNWHDVSSQADEVVLDGISLPGATLTAEEAAQGNVRVNPAPPDDLP